VSLSVPLFSLGFTHNPAFLGDNGLTLELVDLAETEVLAEKPTKAIEFSPQVTHFFLHYKIFRDF